eukprot:m.362916 g.362916  ORF g.362916 m.362916 type:complete len:83 (-) comp21172_c0_seq1:666-914(-)
MHKLVANLYRRYLIVAAEHHIGYDAFKSRVKAEFRKNSHLKTEEEIVFAVHRGRWYLKNVVIPSLQIRKYRQMKHRYDTSAT